jgi:hypothetical protein
MRTGLFLLAFFIASTGLARADMYIHPVGLYWHVYSGGSSCRTKGGAGRATIHCQMAPGRSASIQFSVYNSKPLKYCNFDALNTGRGLWPGDDKWELRRQQQSNLQCTTVWKGSNTVEVHVIK